MSKYIDEKKNKSNNKGIKKLSIVDVTRMQESFKTTDFEEVKKRVNKYYFTISTKLGR